VFSPVESCERTIEIDGVTPTVLGLGRGPGFRIQPRSGAGSTFQLAPSEVPSTDAEHVWMLRSCDSTKVVIWTSIHVWIEYAERARLLVKLIVMQPRKPDLPSSRPRSGGKHESDLQFQDCEGSIEAEVRVRGIPMSTPMAPPETQAPGSIKVRIQIPVMDVDQTNLPCWCATQHLGGMVY